MLVTHNWNWLQTIFFGCRDRPRPFLTNTASSLGSSLQSFIKSLGKIQAAAYMLIFATHVGNIFLVFLLARHLLVKPSTAFVVAWIFAINPITLGTLTWISCYSYIIGTWFALISLLVFLIGLNSLDHLCFFFLAAASFFLGLLCSHEIFFLPLIFIGLGWLKGSLPFRRSIWLSVTTGLLALLIFFSFYRFSRYGIQANQLFSLDFIAVLISTIPSSAFCLSFAYMVSFFTPYLQILKTGFLEPVRWVLALCCWALLLLAYRPTHRWRSGLVFFWFWSTLILPYILRLYLMPETVQYHISYILSGRVFYISFIGLALMMGLFFEIIIEKRSQFISYTWFWLIFPTIAYLNLYTVYSAKDFKGLSVSTLSAQTQSILVSWNPFSSIHGIWLFVFVIVTIGLVMIRKRISLNLSFRF